MHEDLHHDASSVRPLIDTHGRHIRYVRVSITDRCNLRCRYCMPPSGVEWIPHDRIMRYEEYLRMIRICSSRGVDKVRITGGEPLVRRGIKEFIENIREIEGVKDLSLTTNGVLLSSMAHDLKAAGLSRLNISLDTLNKDKFIHITGVDAFDRVIAGIQSAVDAGFQPVKINVVAIRGFNDDEIPSFAGLTRRYDVEVRFIELMPMGCATRYGDCEVIASPEIRRMIAEKYGPLEDVRYDHGPARVYRIKGAPGRIGLIGAMSEQSFCGRCNRIRITANGHLRPCLFSEREIDLLTPMRNGISDEELEFLIEQGVKSKKLNHGLCSGSSPASRHGCPTLMNTVGG
jgi:cyclic pyranopterin phosphate synthase